MAQGVYKVTEQFEKALCDYTGAPYAVALDNMSNALFLSLYYENIRGRVITIPSRTYPSVPCEIIHAGGRVKFKSVKGETLKGAYPLRGSKTWDSALRFTCNMYIPDTFMCISFTGAYKRLKLSKGGAILLDDYNAYKWFKKARFSGRGECSYFDDDFTSIGWNMYMMPELAARGLLLINEFYDDDGAIPQEDIELRYPDLSRFKIYTDETQDQCNNTNQR